MNLIETDGIRKYYGGREEAILDGVTLELHPGERVGLIGPNGCGKSTLLKVIAGVLDPDGGTVRLHPGTVVGYLEQSPSFAPGRTVYEEAHSALEPLLAIQREFDQVAIRLAETASSDPESDEHQRLVKRLDFLQNELHRHDAYQLDHRVEAVLEGLEFPSETYDQPACSLSGGEVNRLVLAKLLLSDPDVLLLDEPSNHLDIEMTQWLEKFLVAHRAAMIIVSHDRWFLDRTTTHTFELFHGTVDRYTGNFSAYRSQQTERVLVQRRTWEKQQDEIAKMEDFIRRNHYGEKHAQAEDRRKKLERLERVSPPREIATPPFFMPEPQRSGDVVLRVEGLAKSYDRPLFESLTFDLLRGQRWAILGPNGCGKTTLLRCILGEEKADHGTVFVGAESKIGYFDQQLTSLDPELEVADAVRPPHKEMELPKRRDHLARFGITGDDVFKKIGTLSGGERCRVALARLAVREPNVLILDEPTNHLDLWARDALEQVLRKYPGTVLFISHDRFFVNQVADHLLIVEPGRWRTIDGNYATYEMLCEGGTASGEAMKARQTGTSRGSLSSQYHSSRAASQPSKSHSKKTSRNSSNASSMEPLASTLPNANGSAKKSGATKSGATKSGSDKHRHRSHGAAQRFQALSQSSGPTGEDFSNLPDAQPWDPRKKVPLPPADTGPTRSAIPAATTETPGSNQNSPSPQPPVRRRRKHPYRKVAEIEADIAAHEKRIEEIHQLFTQPEIQRDGAKVQDLWMELDSLKLVLEDLYDHWEEAMELNW